MHFFFFFQLAFLDNLEQVKTLPFPSALLCCGFPGAGRDFQKLCVPGLEKQLGRIEQNLHWMLVPLAPVFFSSCSHRLPSCLDPCLIISLKDPGLNTGFQSLRCFSGICAVVVCSAGRRWHEQYLGDSSGVSRPVDQGAASNPGMLGNKSKFLSNPKIESWTG